MIGAAQEEKSVGSSTLGHGQSAESQACLGDFTAQRWVVLMLIEERPVVLHHFDDDLVANLFEAGHRQDAFFIELGVEVVDGSTGLAQADLGIFEVGLGAVPLPEDTREPGAEGDGQRCGEAGDPWAPAAPANEMFDAGGGSGSDRFAMEPASEIGGELAGGLEAPGGLTGHRLQADRFQVAGDRVIKAARRDGVFVEDSPQNGVGCPCKWRLAGE